MSSFDSDDQARTLRLALKQQEATSDCDGLMRAIETNVAADVVKMICLRTWSDLADLYEEAGCGGAAAECRRANLALRQCNTEDIGGARNARQVQRQLKNARRLFNKAIRTSLSELRNAGRL